MRGVFSLAVWAVIAVAAWITVLAVLVVTVLRPSTRRETAERDAFERAAGRDGCDVEREQEADALQWWKSQQ